jgi:hypothetical protein
MSGSITSTDEFSFTADNQNFDLILTVEGDVAGSGTVTAVGGSITIDGETYAATGPTSDDGADNVISTDPVYVDDSGITFLADNAAQEEVNVYSTDGQTISVSLGDSIYTATDVSLTVTCFVEGTRIATPTGDVRVEALSAGDTVLCADGRTQTISWIGKRDVDLTRHPESEKVRPVGIAPHAFGPGLPASPLFLSPDHAIYAEGVLIPVRYLINDSSVAQLAEGARARATYYHVELPTHDVLLAEGLAVESYLDTGNRDSFSNGDKAIALFPDFSPLLWDAKGYAPLCVTGPEVERVRTLLSERIANSGSSAVQVTRTAA